MPSVVPGALTLPQAFVESARRHASRVAVRGEDGESLTYAALDARRRMAARALLALDIRAGDRVAIWAPNSLPWIIAALALQSLGAVLVPINTRMRGGEVTYVLERAAVRLLFCAGRFLDQYVPDQLGASRPAGLQHLVVLGGIEGEDRGDRDWAGFLASGSAIAEHRVDECADRVAPNDLMDIMFTSGTTGRPKGVMSGHGQNLTVAREWARHTELSSDDRYLVVNPFFHAFGYKAGWLAALLSGATVLPHAVFDAHAVMRRIESEKVSVLPGPPTLFISLLNAPDRSRFDLRSLRATITGAATIAPSLIERMRAELGFSVLLTAYGLTECCGMVSFCQKTDDAATIAHTCGQALHGTEVRIVDAKGCFQPAGQAGEVVVRGYNVMQGYLDDPQATAEAIDPHGWLHTGDIGVLDERGYLRITDRLKDMYITGGFNCYPAEIERMMSAHPAIAQVAVVGIADERQGEVGKAYVVTRPDSSVDAAALIAWCRLQMANYKVPRVVEIVPSLPTNASGKVMKFQLRNAVSTT